MPSAVYNDNNANEHVVGLFFHIFIIVMVGCTLSVIICVGVKVAKERHRDECMDENRHSHNQDVATIQEVLAIPQPGTGVHYLPKSLSTIQQQSDCYVPESIANQSGFDKAML